MNPIVSIGVPVYNGGSSFRDALDSLTRQTYKNIEIIIADNCSFDQTESVCREYAQNDSRIRYVRHPKNIGAVLNFKYLLSQATGKYFMWAAADDKRSDNFVEINLAFLETHPDFVASTCPNAFGDQIADATRFERFSLDGSTPSRVQTFFKYCWVSHAMYYCLARTNELKKCPSLGSSFVAADWALILELAKQGKLHRVNEGWILFGTGGVSNSPNAFKAFRNNAIEIFLPMAKISRITIELVKDFSFDEKIRIWNAVIKVNMRASVIQLIFLRHQFIQIIKATMRRLYKNSKG